MPSDNVFKETTVYKQSDKRKKTNSQEEEAIERSEILDQLEFIKIRLEDIKEIRKDIHDIKSLSKKLTRAVTKINELKKELHTATAKIEKQEEKIEHLMTRIDGQSKEIEALQHDSRKTKDRVYDTEVNLNSSTEAMTKISENYKDTQREVIDQRARSMQDNLIFFGIKETKDENVERVVLDFIKTKMNISVAPAIVRAHRLGAPKKSAETYIGQNANKPRPIIAKFLDYRQRELVRSARFKLKSPFGVNEDLPREVRAAQASLRPELREIKRVHPGKKATIAFPATLIVDGQIIKKIRRSRLL